MVSEPRTGEEHLRAAQTQLAAGPAENLVSTACPGCGVRFAMLARLDAGGWHLRCTACRHTCDGELKEGSQ